MASKGEPKTNAVGITLGRKTKSAGIAKYCADHGLVLTAVHGSEGGRQDAIDAACKSRSILIADSLPCVADTMLEVVRLGIRLMDAGADLILLAPHISTREASPDAVFAMLAEMADLEYHRLADRLPYGYAVADDLVHIMVDPVESAVIRRIVEWYRKDVSPADIAARLNAEGTLARRADAWTSDAVRNVIDHAITSRWDGLE